MKKINTFELWTKNWNDAEKYFHCKGNIETRSRLKDKWYKSFMKIFKDIENELQ